MIVLSHNKINSIITWRDKRRLASTEIIQLFPVNGGLVMKNKRQSRFLVIAIIMLAYAMVSCDRKPEGPYSRITAYGKETVGSGISTELTVEIENGKIDVYTHDSGNVVFETSIKASAAGNADSIKEKMREAGYTGYSIKDSNGKIMFKCPGDGNFKGLYDVRTDVVIYIPVRTKSVNIRVEKGSITFHDDMKCDVDINANTAGIKINRLNGRIRIDGKVGNVRISSGKLKNGSQIRIGSGNLYIAADEYQPGKYSFETERGNITVINPKKSEVTYENLGIVKEICNSDPDHAVKISLRSDIGEISVKNTDW